MLKYGAFREPYLVFYDLSAILQKLFHFLSNKSWKMNFKI